MPKYLIQATYTAEGLRGVMKDTASGRKATVTRMVEAAGGKVEGFYFSLGDYDAVLIVDAPDNITGTALSLAACASGLVRTNTTSLLTAEEMDQAIAKSVNYVPPGSG